MKGRAELWDGRRWLHLGLEDLLGGFDRLGANLRSELHRELCVLDGHHGALGVGGGAGSERLRGAGGALLGFSSEEMACVSASPNPPDWLPPAPSTPWGPARPRSGDPADPAHARTRAAAGRSVRRRAAGVLGPRPVDGAGAGDAPAPVASPGAEAAGGACESTLPIAPIGGIVT